MTRQVFDHQGRPIVIGKELGRGGEGAVFEVGGNQDYVAKIYLKPAVSEKAQKLSLMIRLQVDSVKKVAAWPVASLHQHVGGPTIGLVMPKITKPTEIHELYSPAHRKVTFPASDWRFLVRTALNCAAAFQSLHAAQIIIGDVNQGNILVSTKATVNLIDCDSFQISANGTTYKCKVGVAHFTPPELSSYDELRTVNHDNFGLAVMIFHLLFMGRHPYSGRFSGRGEMPLEKAIKENRFVYGSNASAYQMAPPPHCLSLQELTADISTMFEKAFAPPQHGLLRPTSSQWLTALLKLESGMRTCPNDPGHFHFQGVRCPWCRIMQAGGPNFFISVSMKATALRSANFNLSKIWNEIQNIRRPSASFTSVTRQQINSLAPHPVPSTIDATKEPRLLLASIATGAGILTLFSYFAPVLSWFTIPITIVSAVWWAILWFMSPIRKEAQRRRAILSRHISDMNKSKYYLSAVYQRHIEKYESTKQKLLEAKERFENLSSLRDTEYRRLQSHAKERQLEEFLERCFISSSNIRGIGRSRIVTLESYGIETAADVTYERVSAVPGFGPMLTSELVNWRILQEASFKFDPKKGAPASAVQALDMQYLQLRSQLQSLLETGASALNRITYEANAEVRKLDEKLANIELAVKQAELDVQVMDR